MGLKNAFAALFCVFVFTTTATAQEVANNTTFGNWIVRCDAVTTTQTSCRLVQTMSRTSDKSLVVRFVVLPAANGSALFLAQVPMGVYLPAAAVVRWVNSPEGEQKKMTWQRCMGEICEAALAISPSDLANFTKAGDILFGYRMQVREDPTIVKVDVSRLSEAVSALASSAQN